MRRTSLISSRPTRALRDRPATDTRLSPSPFPHSGDGRSIDSPRHTCLPGFPCGYAPSLGRLAPAMREGLYPDFVGSPEGIAPRDYSAVSPLGDSHSPRDGKESALPSLRMVERLPHTHGPELTSSPIDLRVWCRLAPWPLRPGHGPSIAYPTLPTAPTFYTVIPDPDREPMGGGSARPERSRRVSRAERGGVPPWRGTANTNQRPSHCHSDAPRGIWGGVLSSSPSIELEAEVGALAPTSASVLLSPSPLKALRERGRKGERVPPSPTQNPRKSL